MKTPINNQAFIDAQNLHLGTTKVDPMWQIDHARFRVLLKQRYGVSIAYYFIGVYDKNHKVLYNSLTKAGYELIFREHSGTQVSKKKGNVDNDIIFNIMKKLCEREPFGKVVLISGDGDYKRMVDYLIEKDRLLKILFPNKRFASSLYKNIKAGFRDYLDDPSLKSKIIKK
jgi:uncharacterized LabA/DUF88 family protein